MIRITYDEYDEIEEKCEQLRKQNEAENIGTPKYFAAHYNFPTVKQMEDLNVENHIDEYFIYLMFWYTQKFDEQIKDDLNSYKEYKESMKYIKNIIDSNIEFIDDGKEDWN